MLPRSYTLAASLAFLTHAACSESAGTSATTAGAGAGGTSAQAGTAGASLGGTTNVAGNGAGATATNSSGNDAGGTAGVSGSANGGGNAGAPSGGGGSAGAPSSSGKKIVFVGGFGSDPIRSYDLNVTTGALSERMPQVDAGPEPSCLTTDASRTHLYVCNEAGGADGGLTSFNLRADGSLEKPNHRAGMDGGFTELAVSPDGKLIAGAGYDGGSASVFPIGADGSVGVESGSQDFGASSQTHYVLFDPTGQFLFATTKGTNEVQQLKVSSNGQLTANTPPSVPVPQNGPRHMALHPSGKLVFVVTESGSTVMPFRLSATGTLTAGTSVSTLPASYQGGNSGAHVELGHDGQILYVSNRGHDSVAAFHVDQESGALSSMAHYPSGGASPHDFDIDTSGKLLITANRKGNSLTVFRIEQGGSLTMLGEPVPTRAEPTAVLIVDL